MSSVGFFQLDSAQILGFSHSLDFYNPGCFYIEKAEIPHGHSQFLIFVYTVWKKTARGIGEDKI